MRTAWRTPLLIAVMALLLGTYFWREPVHWAHYTDPVVYLCGAESLAEGHGYRYIAYVNSPKIGCHPPLQSAYLSLFWRLHPQFPENIRLLYAAMILSAAATFVLFQRLSVRSGLPAWGAALLILVWGFSTPWGTLIYSFMSDVLFGGLWLALALCWMGVTDFDDWRRWLKTGCLLALAYLTRTAAVPLILTVAAILAWRIRRGGPWKPAVACLAPVAVSVLAWKTWSAGAPGYLDYVLFRAGQEGGWTQLLLGGVSNALDYLTGHGFLQSLLPGPMNLPAASTLANTPWSPLLTALLMAGGWVFMACSVYGCWWRGSPVDRAGGFMVLAYLLQLVIYPANLSERCLFAALPFMLVWAWKGRSLLTRWLPNRKLLPGVAGSCLALSAMLNGTSFLEATGFLMKSGYAGEVAELGAWLRTNTPPTTIVAADLSEPIMHLYQSSGRKVMENYFHPQPWFSIVGLSIQGAPTADYLLLSWYSWMKLEDSNFQSFQLVANSSQSRYRLYRVGKKPGHDPKQLAPDQETPSQ